MAWPVCPGDQGAPVSPINYADTLCTRSPTFLGIVLLIRESYWFNLLQIFKGLSVCFLQLRMTCLSLCVSSICTVQSIIYVGLSICEGMYSLILALFARKLYEVCGAYYMYYAELCVRRQCGALWSLWKVLDLCYSEQEVSFPNICVCLLSLICPGSIDRNVAWNVCDRLCRLTWTGSTAFKVLIRVR